jgi:phytoene dehydrogenase-like protein
MNARLCYLENSYDLVTIGLVGEIMTGGSHNSLFLLVPEEGIEPHGRKARGKKGNFHFFASSRYCIFDQIAQIVWARATNGTGGEHMKTYDAVIVGGGLGGLACGAYLARKDRKVIVLEKENRPGGYCLSFQRGDYIFDTLTMLLAVGDGQPNHQLLEALGVADKLEFLKPKHFGRFLFPDHDFRVPNGDLDGVFEVFVGLFPGEESGLRKLFDHMGRITQDAMKFSRSTAPLALQLAFFPLLYRSLFPYLKKTTAQLLDRHIRDPRLKSLILASWSWFGVPPSRLNTSYGVLPTFGYWSLGGYVVKGGSQRLPDALVEVIRENGGEVRLRTPVAKIRTENGKAVGVETGEGEVLDGKAIVSNVSAVDTFYRMVGKEKLPEKLVNRMDSMELSISAFIVFLGLDVGFKAPGSDDYRISIFDSYDHDEGYRQCCDGEHEKSLSLNFSTNVDPSRGRNGSTSLSLFQLHSYEYWKKFEDDYKTGNKEEYNREKERIAHLLIESAEKVSPGISSHTKEMVVATPLTLQRRTGNERGAAYGWANIVGQGGPLDRSPQKTPIGNLYLSSAWTFPGEGCVSAALAGYHLGRRLAG